MTTIGAAYFSLTIPVERQNVEIRMWDTASQERFFGEL
jgi:GTPase SAR1 family protein